MKVLNKKSRSAGFTMIELIIVIAILGILAAFAMPRFASFTSEAKLAAHDGIQSSLNSGIAIAHAKWIAQGSTGSVTLDGGGLITMNPNGYPDVAAAGAYKDATSCQTLVSNLVSGTNANALTVAWDATAVACTIDSTKTWTNKINLTATAAN
jgi:MSHA pilin protein MshA